MDELPEFIPAEEIWALRGVTKCRARFTGLYACGNLEALAFPTVAIVGSRAASELGRRIAQQFAADLGKAGVCVVSGLALGIDGAAHAGALSVGAATIGVLGGGHDNFFPPRNRALAEAMIEKGGAVVSPYAPGVQVRPYRFLERNGIIALLSDAVVVVEAAARSGSLNTAGWAADIGIPVLAVPGDVDRPKVAGCNALIRDGATLVRNADDILEAIDITRMQTPTAHQQSLFFPPDTLQAKIVAALGQEAAYAEDLASAHDAPLPELLSTLAQLMLSGIVHERGDGAYVLTRP